MLCVCGCDGAECHCYGYCCHDRGPYVVRVLKLSYSALQVSDVLFCLHIIMSLMQKYCFSPNPQTFFKKFLANSLHVSILMPTFAIARITMRSTPHSVEKQTEYGGSPSTCFYCPLWRKSIVVLADEEVRAAFFVPLRQTVPDGFGQKG